MGCGSSAGGVDETSQAAPGYKGPINITIKQAVLERDVRFLGVMDPYVKLKMGRQEFTTPVHHEGGKHPKWEGVQCSFRKLIGHEDVIIGQVWCQNSITSDVLIGDGAFSLTQIRKGNSEPKRIQFLIFYGGELAGTITIEVTFTLDPTGKDLPEIKAPDTEGKLVVQPKHATLKRDTNLALKMDPLVTIRFGNETMSSSVCSSGGKQPKWSDSLVFTRETNEDTLYVEVWNECMLGSNDFIGCGYTSITDGLSLKENVVKNIKLFHDGVEAGELQLEYTFKTSEPQKYLAQGESGPQQPNKEAMGMLPKQIANFAQNMDQRYGSQFGQNQQNGRLEFTYPNGDHYSGDLQNNQRHGQGRLTISYGGYYEGQWQYDQYHGHGILMVGDTRYEGQFQQGKKNGIGKQHWNNGQAYEGQWIDNNMSGNGEWTFPNGGKKKGVWANGNRLRWIDDDQNVIQANKTMTSGFMLHSQSGQFTLTFLHDGRLFIIDNQTRQPVFQASSNRPIMPPFWFRFDPSGELLLIDASGKPYWVSGQAGGFFAPPFTMGLQDDGRLVIKDANSGIKWYSH